MRLLLLLVLVAAAGAGGFLTKPSQAEMQAKVDAHFEAIRESQAKAFDLKGLVKGVLTDAVRTSKYEDLTVASRFSVMLDDEPYMTCWGAFRQIMCSEPKAAKG